MSTKSFEKHYEKSVTVEASAEKVFAYADEHRNFSSHMNNSSWMMGGQRMNTEIDSGNGKKVGSHIKMGGNVFGINLFLDEVIVDRNPPRNKSWETIGEINLLVIDHYELGFDIIPKGEKSELKVHIDYNLPKSSIAFFLGRLFGGMYARWCVEKMANDTQKHFIGN